MKMKSFNRSPRYLSILILICSLFNTLYGQTNQWQVYSNGKITFRYPSDWILEKELDEAELVLFPTADRTEQATKLSLLVDGADGLTLEAWSDSLIREFVLNPSIPDKSMTKHEFGKVKGREFFELGVTYPLPEDKLLVLLHGSIVGDKVYLLIFQGLESTSKEYSYMASALFQTVRIKK